MVSGGSSLLFSSPLHHWLAGALALVIKEIKTEAITMNFTGGIFTCKVQENDKGLKLQEQKVKVGTTLTKVKPGP